MGSRVIKNRSRCLSEKSLKESDEALPFSLHYLSMFLIIIYGVMIYSNSFSVPFVLDDVTSVWANESVKSFSLSPKSRVLGELSFALNYRLNGLDPFGYHLVNLILHISNSILVYILVQVIFKTPIIDSYRGQFGSKYGSVSQLTGFAAALIFVSHPLQTQAVTYVSQRVALLAATGYLGAVVCYGISRLEISRITSILLLLLSVLFAVAGILSKENAITVPFSIIFFEYTFFRSAFKDRLKNIVWYIVPLLVIPALLLARIGFTPDFIGQLGKMTAEGGAPDRLSYFLTQFPVVLSYIRLFLMPIGQNLDHDVQIHDSLFDPVVLICASLLLILAGIGFRLWINGRKTSVTAGPWNLLAGFGIGWFFITISVESGFIPIRDVMFEHRVYLPSVGLVLVAVAVLSSCSIALKGTEGFLAPFLVAVIILPTVLGIACYQRNKVWQDEISLWQDTSLKSPGKGRVHGSLGHALQRSGRIDEAIKSYLKAVSLSPVDQIARNNLGTIYLMSAMPAEALEQFDAALMVKESTTLHYNRGLALEKLLRLKDAEKAYKQSVRMDNRNDRALNNLGILQYRLGRKSEAAESFAKAVKANPSNSQAGDNLVSLQKSGVKGVF